MAIPAWRDDRVLVGSENHDDAGVFRLSDEQALVQTVDFFTPVVDDPRLFGRIAAVNSLSDIYAMGGTPLTALNLLATPAGVLAPEVVSQMLEGGQEVMTQTRTALIGGHTIDDIEPKMGYAVTGLVHPDHIWRNSTAKPGDRIYLTKAIGTGVIVKAIKDGTVAESSAKAAVDMMSALNRGAKEAIAAAAGDPSACTDVTGFGLLGHLWEMALGAGVRMVLRHEDVPVLPGAELLAEQDRFPAGSRRNYHFVQTHLNAPGISSARLHLLADAVTSGGLLFTVASDRAESVERSFSSMSAPLWGIGEVIDGPSGIDIR